ncbi:hypothetical protein, partial [Nocardia panacis]|uniref:hypothetical protein n=1 Tax=Nocardia panacis TaxID=2340916 RepID=UPI00193931F8
HQPAQAKPCCRNQIRQARRPLQGNRAGRSHQHLATHFLNTAYGPFIMVWGTVLIGGFGVAVWLVVVIALGLFTALRSRRE